MVFQIGLKHLEHARYASDVSMSGQRPPLAAALAPPAAPLSQLPEVLPLHLEGELRARQVGWRAAGSG